MYVCMYVCVDNIKLKTEILRTEKTEHCSDTLAII